MFLLEVVVAGAPLIGLLGTVTGLVEVFSCKCLQGVRWTISLFSQEYPWPYSLQWSGWPLP